MTPKQPGAQLPTDCGPLPRLLYSVDEVAKMFNRAASTIRATCWENKLPYRLETTWGPGGRRFRRMVFSMREIAALLDHYAPPVNQVAGEPALAPPRRLASNANEEKRA